MIKAIFKFIGWCTLGIFAFIVGMIQAVMGKK